MGRVTMPELKDDMTGEVQPEGERGMGRSPQKK